MEFSREAFQEIMIVAELDNDQLKEEYGWGYGETCPAIHTVNDENPVKELYDFLISAGRVAARREEEDGQFLDVDWFARNTRTDQMGKYGMVFFWPYLTLVEGPGPGNG